MVIRAVSARAQKSIKKKKEQSAAKARIEAKGFKTGVKGDVGNVRNARGKAADAAKEKAASRARVDAAKAERAKGTSAAKARVAERSAVNVERNKGAAARAAAFEKGDVETRAAATEVESPYALTPERKMDLAFGLAGGAKVVQLGKGVVFKRGAEWVAKYTAQKAAAEAAELAAKQSGSKAAKSAAVEAAESVQTTWAKGFGLPTARQGVAAASSGKLTQAFVKSKWVVRPPKPGAFSKLKGYVLNSKMSKLISQGIGTLIVGVGATYLIKEAVESFTFGRFQIGEAGRNLNFALWQAMEAGDEEAIAELLAAGDEAFNEETLNGVLRKFPWLTGLEPAKVDAETAIIAWDAMKMIAENKLNAPEGTSDTEIWVKIAADKVAAAEKELADFEVSAARVAAAKAQANKDFLAAKTAADKEDRRLDLENWNEMIRLTEEAHKRKLERNKKYWAEVNRVRADLQRSQLSFGLLG